MKPNLREISKMISITILMITLISIHLILCLLRSESPFNVRLVFIIITILMAIICDIEMDTMDSIYYFLKPRIPIKTYLKFGFSYKEIINFLNGDNHKSIIVWNNLLPSDYFEFLNVNNDPHLLDRVKEMSPQRFMEVILHNSYHVNQEIPTSVFSDKFNNFDIARVGFMLSKENSKPLCFTCMQKEKQEVVKEDIALQSIKNENKQINLDRLKTTSIGKVISEIDVLLQKGYVFENISIDRYKDGYRKDCMDIISSQYNMSQEQETKILTILQTLRDNMYDKKEKQHTLDTDVSIKAMEELLKYDGIINNLKM